MSQVPVRSVAPSKSRCTDVQPIVRQCSDGRMDLIEEGRSTVKPFPFSASELEQCRNAAWMTDRSESY